MNWHNFFIALLGLSSMTSFIFGFVFTIARSANFKPPVLSDKLIIALSVIMFAAMVGLL